MTEMNIRLSQLENTDLPRVQEFFSRFKPLLNEHREYSAKDIGDWFSKINDNNSVYLAIKGSETIYRNFLAGVCGLHNIDWVARHAEIFFIMIDKDGVKATIHNHFSTKQAFSCLLDFAFMELNLNKVWIEVYEHNDIKEVLEEFGFVAEGIRIDSLYKEGKFLNSIICSLLVGEYLE